MLTTLAGLVAGALHVVAGPDHLAALAPLAAAPTGRWRRGWELGSRWGLGHAVGVALVALVALALRGLLPVGVLSSVGERLVGVVLVGIGLVALRRALRQQVDQHAHTHPHAPFAIGVLHGIAGGSHLAGVLPALALPSRAAAVTYLCGFGVGTVAAMVLFTSMVSLVAGSLAARARRGMLYACASAAIAIGAVWILV